MPGPHHDVHHGCGCGLEEAFQVLMANDDAYICRVSQEGEDWFRRPHEKIIGPGGLVVKN